MVKILCKSCKLIFLCEVMDVDYLCITINKMLNQLKACNYEHSENLQPRYP